MKNKIILDLCGGTGAWSRPYKEAGYTVYNITLPEYDVNETLCCDGLIKFKKVGYLNHEYIKANTIYGVLAAPPCTMFSRARTTAKTPRDFKGAMETVYSCLRIIWECQYNEDYNLKFWAIENPAGHLKRFLGNPAFKFHPYDFGDRYSKQTFLWGMFNEPKKNPVDLSEEELVQSRNNTRKLPIIPPEYVRDESMKTVQIKRSITPKGFAEAFFKANQ